MEKSLENFYLNLELAGAIARFRMTGDLTHTAEQRLLTAYGKASAAKARYIILDFNQVEYINSAGLSVIISMLTQAQNRGQELRACGLTPHFLKIFNMVGLAKYIRHYPSLESAEEGLSG